MKALTYIFALFVLIASVSATCYNQDDSPFCSKDDPTCTVSGEADTDNDGWSDSCDAFADNELFWVDYDGDNIGYGSLVYDCNDLDDSILTYCGDTSLLEEEEEEVIETNTTTTNSTNTNSTTNSTSQDDDSGSNSESSSGSSNSRRGRFGHSNRIGITYVSDPDLAFLEQENLAGDVVEEEPLEDVFVPKEIIPLVDPTPIDNKNKITGAVTGVNGELILWPFWALVILVLTLLVLAKKHHN